MPVPKRRTDALLALLTELPAWFRAAAATLLVVLVVNLFYHGAQPYAVGLIPPPWDKLAHIAFFGSVAGLAWVSLGGSGPIAAFGAIATAVGIGAIDEAVQSLLPGRSSDAGDLTADLVGAALVVWLLWVAASAFRANLLSKSRQDRSES